MIDNNDILEIYKVPYVIKFTGEVVDITIPSTTNSTSVGEPCKCCDGKGTQQGFDGIVILCPCCKGKGVLNL
jgi:hypothetical protein